MNICFKIDYKCTFVNYLQQLFAKIYLILNYLKSFASLQIITLNLRKNINNKL